MTWIEVLKIVVGLLASLGGGGAIIVLLSSWLGRVWADRMLERLRIEGTKESFRHQLQFDKEFHIYEELWHSVLPLCRAASRFRGLQIGGVVSDEEANSELVKTYNCLNQIVHDNRPFYAPLIYDSVKKMLRAAERARDGYQAIRRLEESRVAQPDTAITRSEKVEQLLDELNAEIEPLCEAIRERIFGKMQ